MSEKTIIITAAIIALAIGFFISSELDEEELEQTPARQPSERILKIGHVVVDPPKIIAMPVLYKDDDSRLVLDDIKGRWTLMFFGYTHCPDICPTTMAVLAESKKQSKTELDLPFPDVILVSVDPERDTTKLLKDYVDYFDVDFTGATGELKMLQALTLQTGVVFMKVPGKSGDEKDYIVDHSASILLFNPEGKLHAYLNAPHTPGSILKNLKELMQQSSAQ